MKKMRGLKLRNLSYSFQQQFGADPKGISSEAARTLPLIYMTKFDPPNFERLRKYMR
jgi:hypothetical protein